MAGSMHVEPHTPALGALDPDDVGTVAAATEAGMTAASQRYSHYEAKTHGFDATCGDPMAADSTLQSWEAPGLEHPPSKNTL